VQGQLGKIQGYAKVHRKANSYWQEVDPVTQKMIDDLDKNGPIAFSRPPGLIRFLDDGKVYIKGYDPFNKLVERVFTRAELMLPDITTLWVDGCGIPTKLGLAGISGSVGVGYQHMYPSDWCDGVMGGLVCDVVAPINASGGMDFLQSNSRSLMKVRQGLTLEWTGRLGLAWGPALPYVKAGYGLGYFSYHSLRAKQGRCFSGLVMGAGVDVAMGRSLHLTMSSTTFWGRNATLFQGAGYVDSIQYRPVTTRWDLGLKWIWARGLGS